jgi:hypothetical protein
MPSVVSNLVISEIQGVDFYQASLDQNPSIYASHSSWDDRHKPLCSAID